MTTTVLAAGDRFVLPSLLADAVRSHVGTAGGTGSGSGGGVRVRELTLPWPHVPFGPVAEVDEASGREERMVDALVTGSAARTARRPRGAGRRR